MKPIVLIHGYSAETSEGRDALWKTLLRVGGIGAAPEGDPGHER